MIHPVVSRPLQARFLDIPQAPLIYWLPTNVLELVATPVSLGQCVTFKEGLNSTDNNRFVRYEWECSPANKRWWSFAKGGFFGRWWNANVFRVNWGNDGALMKLAVVKNPSNKHWSRRIIGIEHFQQAGIYYPLMCRGSLGIRYLEGDGAFDSSAVCIFPRSEDVNVLAGFLNTHLASYLARCVSQSLTIREGYTARLPKPPIGAHGKEIAAVSQLCRHVKQLLVRFDPTERSFCSKAVYSTTEFIREPGDAQERTVGHTLAHMAMLHVFEAMIERITFVSYGLDATDEGAVTEETGHPAGWHPLIAGYDRLPPLPDGLAELPPELNDFLATLPKLECCPSETRALLRTLYEAGPGATVEEDEDDLISPANDDESEAVAVGARIPIPAETFLEELSQKLEVHPISVYWLLREGIETEGWRCLPEERRLWGDRITVAVLRLLGHRWPKQIEAGEPVPEWADADGVIPLTEGLGAGGRGPGTRRQGVPKEWTLFERVSERLEAESSEVSNPQPPAPSPFPKPLDAWLATEFFRHHTGQFKRRPIAWQIQSERFTARTKPAFACLAYYHKVDGDVLPKIRTQYVGPLRQRWETELRGIESVASAARSVRQAGRHTELADLIKELDDFDASLRNVQESGFDTSRLRQFAIDDALLCMKARWLRRLSETIEAGPLGGWKSDAAQTGIHEELPDWIDEAMAHLDHHCSRVQPEQWEAEMGDGGRETGDGVRVSGPRPPTPNPAPQSLATLICEKPASLVPSALQFANQRWWKRLDDEVLAPLRQEMGQKRAALKDVQAELKDLAALAPSPRPPAPNPSLREEERRLKQEIKDLKDEIDRIKDSAEQLRDRISAWHCPEAAAWEPWLAGQPMYDAISSVDGRRRPPTTVVEWVAQERSYMPDINDGVRVNIAPLQKAGLLAADVLAKKDLDKAIADRAAWRADERRWCREGKLPQPGWWPEYGDGI